MENRTRNKLKVLKMILLVATIILLLLLTIKLLPLFKSIGTSEGQIEFKEKISSLGIGGVFVLLGMQLLQIVVPILPGEPIEFIAGMCYGTFGGMIVIFIGAFLSSCIIFFCVRKFGRDFIETFFKKESIEKLENSKLLSNPQTLEMIFFILFLIPGTPKDLFVYIAGLLPIRTSRFLLISTFARFPSVISSTFAGSNIMKGNWHLSIISYAITFLLTGIAIVFYRKHQQKLAKKEKLE